MFIAKLLQLPLLLLQLNSSMKPLPLIQFYGIMLLLLLSTSFQLIMHNIINSSKIQYLLCMLDLKDICLDDIPTTSTCSQNMLSISSLLLVNWVYSVYEFKPFSCPHSTYAERSGHLFQHCTTLCSISLCSFQSY